MSRLILVTMLFVVQFALAYYARTVVSGAAQDGASAAARRDASTNDGVALAESLVEDAAGSLLESPETCIDTGRNTDCEGN